MATFFRTALSPAVGTVETLLAQTGSGARFTVIGFSLSNMTESIVLASVRIDNEATSTSTYFVKDVILPPNQSLRIVNGGEKLIIPPSSNVFVQSNTTSSLDAVMSYVEIL
jgi:hypothetical protein